MESQKEERNPGRQSFPIANFGVVRFLWLAILGLALVSCSKAPQQETALGATRSSEAVGKLRVLEERWELEGNVGRRALRTDLDSFVEEYGLHPRLARAQVMLAQIALLERRFGSAEEGLASVLDGPPGTLRDEALVILAAIDEERGNYEGALVRLEPLAGKLLRREARDQYSRVRIGSAIEARRWRLAVEVMTSWLTESEPETAHVRAWIESAVDQVPSRALARLLVDWEDVGPQDQEALSRQWLYRVLIRRLRDEALAKQDPLLAKELLERAPPWLRGSKDGNALAVLAARARKDSRVVGRAIGVVLGGGSDEQRRRAVKVVSGILRGLGLGLASEGPDPIRFLAVEDRGSIASALDTLTGLGASILVAGVDDLGAQDALHFAETRQVPVVTMGAARSDLHLKYGFVLGVGREGEKRALEGSVPSAKKWVFVGDGEISCTQSNLSSSVAFPVAEWRKSAIDAVGVLGDPACMRRVLRHLARFGWHPMVIAGLGASHARYASKQKVLRLHVGQFPLNVESSLEGRMSERERGVSGTESDQNARAGDWFFSLGMDAALLIREALMTLPDNSVTQKDQVKVRHQQARSALLLARAELVTTSVRGFSAEHHLAREFSVSLD